MSIRSNFSNSFYNIFAPITGSAKVEDEIQEEINVSSVMGDVGMNLVRENVRKRNRDKRAYGNQIKSKNFRVSE